MPRRPSAPDFPGGPWGPTGPVFPTGPSAPASPYENNKKIALKHFFWNHFYNQRHSHMNRILSLRITATQGSSVLCSSQFNILKVTFFNILQCFPFSKPPNRRICGFATFKTLQMLCNSIYCVWADWPVFYALQFHRCHMDWDDQTGGLKRSDNQLRLDLTP